jgi:hypothetical protein
VQVVANSAHYHLARVQPDADLDVEPLLPSQLLGIPPDGRLHVQGRIARPYRVVLMGHGGAKQGHDAVAHDLVHRALITVHGRHHAFEHRIEELAGLFRIPIRQEFHRALEVGKQHGDLFALAFQGAAGQDDLLGEIGGRVDERRRR